MTDYLRDKIAAVVAGTLIVVSEGHDGYSTIERDAAETLADAVINELGLEPQMHYDPDCEFYRYVTDWIDPQTNHKVDLP